MSRQVSCKERFRFGVSGWMQKMGVRVDFRESRGSRKTAAEPSFHFQNLLEAMLGEGEWMPRPDSWMQGAEHGQFRVQQDAECLR